MKSEAAAQNSVRIALFSEAISSHSSRNPSRTKPVASALRQELMASAGPAILSPATLLMVRPEVATRLEMCLPMRRMCT